MKTHDEKGRIQKLLMDAVGSGPEWVDPVVQCLEKNIDDSRVSGPLAKSLNDWIVEVKPHEILSGHLRLENLVVCWLAVFLGGSPHGLSPLPEEPEKGGRVFLKICERLGFYSLKMLSEEEMFTLTGPWEIFVQLKLCHTRNTLPHLSAAGMAAAWTVALSDRPSHLLLLRYYQDVLQALSVKAKGDWHATALVFGHRHLGYPFFLDDGHVDILQAINPALWPEMGGEKVRPANCDRVRLPWEWVSRWTIQFNEVPSNANDKGKVRVLLSVRDSGLSPREVLLGTEWLEELALRLHLRPEVQIVAQQWTKELLNRGRDREESGKSLLQRLRPLTLPNCGFPRDEKRPVIASGR